MARENDHELSSADVSLHASGSNGQFTNGQEERLRVQPMSLEVELEPRARATAGGAKQAQHGPSGDWYHSAFHTVTAVVGAGVLGLPFALSFLGWTAGMFCLVFSLIVSFYTSYLLASLHEQPDGTRYNTYRALGRKLLGDRAGLWAIVPFQSIVMVGLGITYLVTAGQSLKYVQDANRSGDDPGPLSLTAWIGVFSVLQLFLSQLPDFHSLWWVSLIGAAMSCFYASIAAAASAAESEVEEVSYSIRGESMADKVFGVLNALGTITFAYGGHSVLLEIQATLRSPPRTVRPMMNGVIAAYIVVFLAYFSVAITGYYRFGNQVQADVLLSVSHPVWLVSLANMMVVVHVAASYQIYSQPIFAVIEEAISAAGWRVKPLAVRLVWRSAYVGMTCFMAMTFPFFGDLMGLAGALGFTPMTFVVPSVLWLRAAPRPWWDVCINVSIIALFSFVGVIAAVGALRLIIVEASSYDFYS